MKPISTSIIHLGLFILVGLLSFTAFAKSAVTGVSGVQKIFSLFNFHHQSNLNCEFQNIFDLNQNLSGISAQPNCSSTSCLINVLIGDQKKSFSPVNHAGISQIDIGNFFYVADRQLVSFTTSTPDLSSRIVMNFDGELIQSIDETPGKDRWLVFKGYQPETGMLVYFDQKSGYTYFYSIDSIYLARRRCP